MQLSFLNMYITSVPGFWEELSVCHGASNQAAGSQATAGCHLGSGHLGPWNHYIFVVMETNLTRPHLHAVWCNVCGHMAASCRWPSLDAERRKRRSHPRCPVGKSLNGRFLPDIPQRNRVMAWLRPAEFLEVLILVLKPCPQSTFYFLCLPLKSTLPFEP